MISRTAFLILVAALALAQCSPLPYEEHIVILNQTQASSMRDVWSSVDLDDEHIHHIFNNSAFTGFAAKLQSCHAERLFNMSDVSLVEKSTTIAHTGLIRRAGPDVRADATWGLERLSNVYFKGTDTDTMDYTYSFANPDLGRGADIYIVDSGIWTAHNGFGGRANMLWSFDGQMTDTDGHGTHVAGTAGGMDFGVASNANIWGVRVLDAKGGGTTASVIAGIDQVVRQHDKRKTMQGFSGSVMSMSLEAGTEVVSLDQAIQAAIGAGIHTCVAAGNDGADACKGSPATAGGTKGSAITVGSIDIDGQRSSFSNYGECTDVFAPGQEVLSAGLNDPNLLASLSGTSQATPHVSGLVAYAFANKTLAQSPQLMKEWIKSTAIQMGNGIVLANNGAGGKAGEGMLGFGKVAMNWDVRQE